MAEGVLLVDKPIGLSSYDVVRKARQLTGVRRIGHTGTLDPLATGLLILCVGRATRLAEYVAERRKSYQATVRLGLETNTYDAEGEIVSERPVSVTEAELIDVLGQFRGEIYQVPPMFSAVKHAGQPLYKSARQGLTIDRSPRAVTVYELELLLWDSPCLQLQIVCSSGTYVRSLAHDVGMTLGCGGHVSALRRTKVGDFDVKSAVILDRLTENNWGEFLWPMDVAVHHLPRLILSEDEALKLCHGQRVPHRPGQPEAAIVRAYQEDGRFVGVVISQQQQWQARKIFYQLAA